jgi:hypothetical protein
MEQDLINSGELPTLGYDRAAVEDFLRAAAEERVKLRQQIDSANLRLARARTALGTHRVMVAMLLETQRELSTMRRDAELQAAEIIGAAEREARVREESGRAGPGPIDLRDSPFAAPAPATLNGERASASSYETVNPYAPGATTDPTADSEFFEFLRGALDDEEPLGPRSL